MSVAHSIDPSSINAIHAARGVSQSASAQSASAASAANTADDDSDAVSSFTSMLPGDIAGALVAGGAAAAGQLLRSGTSGMGVSGLADINITVPTLANTQAHLQPQHTQQNAASNQQQSQNGAAQATNNAAGATHTDKRTTRHTRKSDQDSSDAQATSNTKDDKNAAAVTAPIVAGFAPPVDLPLPTTKLAAAPTDATKTAASPTTTTTTTANATAANTPAPVAETAAPVAQVQPDVIRFVKPDNGTNTQQATAQPNTQAAPTGTGTTQVKVTTTPVAAQVTTGGPANPAQAVAAQQAAAPSTNAVTAQVAHDEAAADGRLPVDATQAAPQQAPVADTVGIAGNPGQSSSGLGGQSAGNTGTGAGTGDNAGQDLGRELAGNAKDGGLAAKTAATAIGLAAKAADGDTATATAEPTGFSSVMAGQTSATTGTASTTLTQNLGKTAADTSSANFAQRMAMPVMPSDQLAAAIQRLAPLQRSFAMQLSPEHMGQVDVRLNIDAKGNAKATFTASKPETLVLLQQDSHHLVDALQQAGIQVDQNALSFSLKDGGQGGQANSGFDQASGNRGSGSNSGSQTAMADTDDAANGQQNRSSHLYDLHA